MGSFDYRKNFEYEQNPERVTLLILRIMPPVPGSRLTIYNFYNHATPSGFCTHHTSQTADKKLILTHLSAPLSLHMAIRNTAPSKVNFSNKISLEGLTFDDVLLTPAYSQVLPREVNIQTKLTKDIFINVPMVSY